LGLSAADAATPKAQELKKNEATSVQYGITENDVYGVKGKEQVFLKLRKGHGVLLSEMPTYPIASLSPREAWEPLPRAQWTRDAAAHLLRRISFSATPEATEVAFHNGLAQTLETAFCEPRPMPVPSEIRVLEQSAKAYFEQMRTLPAPERNDFRRQRDRDNSEAFQQYGLKWLEFAHQPAVSAQEKLVCFLQDVFVVSVATVKDPRFLFRHQALIRQHALGDYRSLTKQVARSAAMAVYLDLIRSHKSAPNENYARELMELFTLGEGHYTEADVKAAARAYTGLRLNRAEAAVKQLSARHDDGLKVIFGQAGHWQGDDVVDLIFQQAASRAFLPTELLRYYLSHEPIDAVYIEALAEHWAQAGYCLDALLHRVFQSRLFFLPQFRAQMIKHPVQYLLGGLADLHLDVLPVPQQTMGALRGMGQPFYRPPNVRGLVYGHAWIDSTTLASRRLFIESLFRPVRTDRLNADDQERLRLAEAAGKARFYVTEQQLSALATASPTEAARHLCRRFLPRMPLAPFVDVRGRHINGSTGRRRITALREATVAVMQSPDYHLC
jgi:uncharacterized protein (DUF1800 family)